MEFQNTNQQPAPVHQLVRCQALDRHHERRIARVIPCTRMKQMPKVIPDRHAVALYSRCKHHKTRPPTQHAKQISMSMLVQ